MFTLSLYNPSDVMSLYNPSDHVMLGHLIHQLMLMCFFLSLSLTHWWSWPPGTCRLQWTMRAELIILSMHDLEYDIKGAASTLFSIVSISPLFKQCIIFLSHLFNSALTTVYLQLYCNMEIELSVTNY